MDKKATEELFKLIKPSCVKLSTVVFAAKGSQNDLVSISKSLQHVHNTLVSSLEQVNGRYFKLASGAEVHIDNNVAFYIFAPLTQLLQRPDLNNLVLEYIFKIARRLIDQCWKIDFNEDMLVLFPLVPFLLTGKGQFVNGEAQLVDSIELQKDLIYCGLSLLEAVRINGKCDEFFVKNQNPTMHFVTALLQVIVNNEDLDVIMAAVECLDYLIYKVICDKDLVALIFPGLVSKLLKYLIENKGKKINSQAIVAIIHFLKSIIIYLLGNSNFRQDSEAKLMECTESTKVRTILWLQNTTDKLDEFLPRFAKGYNNSNSMKVKKALLLFCEELAVKCHEVIGEKLTNAFVEIVLQLVGNNHELSSEINFNSNENVQNRISHLLVKSANEVSSVLYTSDQSVVSSKIRAISYSTQVLLSKHANLEPTILGIIENITSELVIMQNSNRSQLSSKNKIRDLKVDMDHKSFPSFATNHFQEKTTTYESGLMMLSRNKSLITSPDSLYLFSDIVNAEVESSLCSFFQTIGKYSIGHKILSSLLLDQGNSSLSKALCLWACNNIILGACEVYGETEEFSVDEYLDLGEADTDESNFQQNVSEDQLIKVNLAENVLAMLEIAQNYLTNDRTKTGGSVDIVCSVSLDTIAVASRYLKRSFEPELMDFLYPVIENLASTSTMVLQHSQNAAIQLAVNVYPQSPSVANLIMKNSDYLLDSLNLKLVNVSITPDTIKVLIVLIKIAGVNLIESLGDVVNSSFVLLDAYHGYSALTNGFFAAFNEISNSVYKAYLSSYNFEEQVFSQHRKDVASRNKPWGINSKEQMFEILDQTKREIPQFETFNTEQDELVDSDDEAFEGSTQVSDNDDTNASEDLFKYSSHVPRNIYLLAQRICSYCIRFLQYPSFSLKIQIFNILDKVLAVLCTQLQELYPVLYELWPLVLNLAVAPGDIRVNIMALQTVHLMFKYGGTFMNKNFIQLWQQLQDNQNFVKYKKKLQYFKRSTKELQLETNALSLTTFGKKHFPESLEYEYYKAVNDVLAFGLRNCGDSVSINLAKNIIQTACGITSDFELFGLHADIAWYVFNH